jgi:D-3-phosphoglycerate dehydrogenase
VVFNTPGANANAVKELVICGMLLSGRKIIDAIGWLDGERAAGQTGIDKLVEKAKNNFVGPELGGKTLGVIGLGAIGVMVANTASLGLNMRVLGYDPYMSVDAAWHLTRSVEQAKSLDEIYSSCDFITLHLPLNDKTRGMVGAKEFEVFKPGAVLLNFARGGLVDDGAVLAALEGGRLGRYVTDFPNDGIVGKKGVIAIPHLGASTPESEENCATMAARQLRDYLLDGNIRNSVNLPDCAIPRNGGARVTVINRNVKNMIGQMSAILAGGGYNIDHLINNSRGDWAYTIFDIDRTPEDSTVRELLAIDGVQRVRVL